MNDTPMARLPRHLSEFYRRELLENIVPFWLRHGVDRECGGYVTCLNRDGSVYSHDKECMWVQGRMAWFFALLYNEVERRPEWLEMARVGVDFTRRHGFAPDGTMYYALTREGRPLGHAQDVHVELSTVMGFSEYARATGDAALHDEARRLFMRVWVRLQTPGQAFQPGLPETRPVRLHGHGFIPIHVLQELRRHGADPELDAMIDACLHTVLCHHLRADAHAVLEAVGWEGESLPGPLGRWVCPGHMIEAGIFLIHEARHRQDAALLRQGADLVDWGFEHGWDAEYGGLYNDIDLEGLPAPGGEVLRYPAKLWWQQAEGLYGALLAWRVTGEERFAAWHGKMHDYAFSRFADPDHGEWYAILGRRGDIISAAKGTARKNIFHLGRNLFWCWRALEGEK